MVVARDVRINKVVDPLRMFTNLLSLYTNAMVYYWHHPKAETWIGATPEQLFSTPVSYTHLTLPTILRV